MHLAAAEKIACPSCQKTALMSNIMLINSSLLFTNSHYTSWHKRCLDALQTSHTLKAPYFLTSISTTCSSSTSRSAAHSLHIVRNSLALLSVLLEWSTLEASSTLYSVSLFRVLGFWLGLASTVRNYLSTVTRLHKIYCRTVPYFVRPNADIIIVKCPICKLR